MGLSGNWKARNGVAYASPLKQGTGWNAVHNTHGGPGRGTATHEQLDTIDPIMVDEFQPDEYTIEDTPSTLYGYGVADGTADRPSLGVENYRGNSQGFPPWNTGRNGVPGGTVIRSRNRGAQLTTNVRDTQPNGLQSAGYKRSGEIEDSGTSDPSQYEMRTSMTQRDKTRAGSQRGAGSDSDYTAPIRSRITGQRIPTYSDGSRHAEMEPKAQDLILRPFYMRSAGTGNPADMGVNEMYVSEPLQRVPTADPYQGTEISSDQSYVDEDVLPYV